MARRPGLARFRRQQPKAPRTEREVALDRIQGARASVARRSLWMKRGSVAVVALAIGFGALQEWTLLRLLAIPLAVLFWWFDASLTCADERLARLYDGVFRGAVEPPVMGQELTAAAERPNGTATAETPDPPHSMRRAMLSGPGASLHWMMAGVAVLFNILA